MSDKNIVKDLIKEHKMTPHPEGGHYVEIFRNDDVTHIYFLLEAHENSHWHRITKTETLHFYSGSPLNIYTSKDGVEFEIDEKLFRPVEVEELFGDSTKLIETTGWKPEFSLEDTLNDLLEFWRVQVLLERQAE